MKLQLTSEMSGYLITTNSEKCVGCYRCIDGCPIVDANVAVVENGENKIHVNGEKCIHCGRCFKSCTHDARIYLDDTEQFFSDLFDKKQISIIAAPSTQTNFPLNYRKFFGYLRSLGVKKIYDVSLGADIASWAYLKHIRDNDPKTMIAQPCPVIVNYIEKYQPTVIKNLAPFQSPMLCTAIFMKTHIGISDAIAAISPCIAKKDEFVDPNSFGNVNYNVTFKKIEEYLTRNDIDIEVFPEVGFDSIQAEFGTLFARPGGLKENIEYHYKDAWVRQLEGVDRIFDYLDDYAASIKSNKVLPLIVDVLNCQRGCNHGTGARECRSIDQIDLIMHQRKINIKNKKTGQFGETVELYKYFDQKLDISKFMRKYDNKSIDTNTPSERQIQMIFIDMLKLTDEEQHIDCSACGYKRCSDMVTSIFRGVNQKTNCINYNKKLIIIEKSLLEEKNVELESALKKLKIINEMSASLLEHNQRLEEYTIMDQLTGLYNRRFLIRKIKEESQRANHFGELFSVLMIDIDFFKRINDNFGHYAGDYILMEASKVMASALRTHDILGRWGGEEFLCILPDTRSSGAFNLAERMRKNIENKEFDYEGREIKITITIGVSEYKAESAADETLKNADMALYNGKKSGRNCTVQA